MKGRIGKMIFNFGCQAEQEGQITTQYSNSIFDNRHYKLQYWWLVGWKLNIMHWI